MSVVVVSRVYREWDERATIDGLLVKEEVKKTLCEVSFRCWNFIFFAVLMKLVSFFPLSTLRCYTK